MRTVENAKNRTETGQTGQKPDKNRHEINGQEVGSQIVDNTPGKVPQITPKPDRKPDKIRYPKTDSRYWLAKVKKRTDGGNYQARIFKDRREVWFDLLTSNKVEASRKAVEVYLHAKANGMSATVDRFKYMPEEGAEVHTVGQFSREVLDLPTTIKKATVDQYAGAFRQIAYEINAKGATRDRLDKVKFDYYTGARAQFLEYVSRLELSTITPDAVEDWRKTKAATTAASQIRQAKAFVAIVNGDGEKRQRLRPKLPKVLPFEGVRTKAPKAKRHMSVIGAGGATLATSAIAELKEGLAEVYKAFLLCFFAGLRKEEADMLYWEQVDLENGIIQVREHDYYSAKSDEAERQIDLDQSVCAELAAMKAKSKGLFVLHSANRPMKVAKHYHGYYRAKPTWKRLTRWLRGKGVLVRKPVHYLRKESGSYVADAFGIEAARQHLGHADIGTTSAFYLDKKSKKSVPMPGIAVATEPEKKEATNEQK